MKNYHSIILIYILIFSVTIGCQEIGSNELTENERLKLENEIHEQLNNYANAIVNKNIDEILNFWSDSDDFVMGGDGSIIGGYNEWKEIAIRDNEQALSWINWDWTNVHVKILSGESASATLEFNYKKVNLEQDTISGYGSWTYVFLKKDKEWKVIHSNGHHLAR